VLVQSPCNISFFRFLLVYVPLHLLRLSAVIAFPKPEQKDGGGGGGEDKIERATRETPMSNANKNKVQHVMLFRHIFRSSSFATRTRPEEQCMSPNAPPYSTRGHAGIKTDDAAFSPSCNAGAGREGGCLTSVREQRRSPLLSGHHPIPSRPVPCILQEGRQAG